MYYRRNSNNNSESINDLPLPPSPKTLSEFEITKNDDYLVDDLNNIKIQLPKLKRAEDNIYVNNQNFAKLHVNTNLNNNSISFN